MEKYIATLFPNEGSYMVSYDQPESCPLCHYAISPNCIGDSWYRGNEGERHLAILYTCPHCHRPFVAHFIDGDSGGKTMQPQLDYCAPEFYSVQQFDDGIENLSPSFVKIYNQALEAESRRLDEIAGIGYRKALEFLVKDYCKQKYSEQSAKIEQLSLSQCISEYIKHPSINTLVSRAVWIGNDETHYTRKHGDRDVSDMKKFIQAIVHYVGMELIVEDAASIAPAH